MLPRATTVMGDRQISLKTNLSEIISTLCTQRGNPSIRTSFTKPLRASRCIQGPRRQWERHVAVEVSLGADTLPRETTFYIKFDLNLLNKKSKNRQQNADPLQKNTIGKGNLLCKKTGSDLLCKKCKEKTTWMNWPVVAKQGKSLIRCV